MTAAPVDPAEVPIFTGDFAQLDLKVKAISAGGAAISTATSDVHSSFGGLSAFYQAPEADQLFATTKPVADLGLKLSSDMCTIAGALGTYARDAEPIAKRLDSLKKEAEAFRTKVASDEHWDRDGDLIDENLERRNRIAEAWGQFQDVERTAHAKIVALVGGTPLTKDDGSHGKGMYGYDAEAMKQAKTLPWGEAVEEDIPAWQIWEHAWEFTKGFFVDGVWGTLKGLGGLVGLQGWDTFKQSWTGLAKLATGLAIISIPGAGPLFMAVPDDKLPTWVRDSRTALKETGKALLAWDQWSSNPGRAAGAVTFNVITTIATGGSGSAAAGAGKAGAVAKALSAAGKVGHYVDPMTYVFKGAGAGISKIGDVMAGLKGLGKVEVPSINIDNAISLPEGTVHLPDGAIHLPDGAPIPEGATKLPDGNIKLPEGTVNLPPDTVKLPGDGPAQFMDPKGNIYDDAGKTIHSAENAPKENPSAGADVPRTDAPKIDSPSTVKVPERELVGVGGRGGDDAIRLGSDTSNPLRPLDNGAHGGPHGVDHTPGGHAPDNMPRGDLNNGPHGNGPHPDTPTTHTPDGPGGAGTHPDTPGGGGTHPDTPGTGGSHPDGSGAGTHGGTGGPSGTGAGHPPQPSGGLDDATRAAHRAEYEAARDVPAKDRTGPEMSAIEREHVRLANEDPAWRAEHYDKWGPGKRNSAEELVDGQLLPKILKQSDGSWVAADSIPHAHPGSFHLTPLERGVDTVPPENLTHLNEVAAKRFAGMELTKWEKAFDESPTFDNAHELALAQEHFDKTVGKGEPNNSGLGEDLGEEAARAHMLKQPEFEGAIELTDLPKTANGSKAFDQLWRDKDGNLVIVEAKSPKGDLEWRLSNGRPDVVKVKQGSIDYVRTILADMYERSMSNPKDFEYAKEIEDALDGIDGKSVRYVLVQANENAGTYAGAVLKYFKL
ncbi:hypothetical protein ACFXB3_16845 [Streptomyces sp. NPDC059447]|uniref:hypothetical protein n=1 Tax=Streptomyces sp. NPDC059447 TaxID=3346834 RepID=UPI00369EF3AD